MVPVPVMQAALDTVLARAADEAKARFGMLLAATRDPAGASRERRDAWRRRAR